MTASDNSSSQPGAILADSEKAMRMHAKRDKGRFGEDGLDLDIAVQIIGLLREELVKALASSRNEVQS
jgi:hypothetical protein